jgi:electron transfer flavoprotein alpha subunit
MTALVFVHAGTAAEAAVTEELVTLARAIADDVGVLATGASSAAVAESAAGHGATWVAAGSDTIERWESDRATDTVAATVAGRNATVLVAAERRFERDVLARVAGRLGLRSLAGCVGAGDGQLRIRSGDGELAVALSDLGPVAVSVEPWRVAPVGEPGISHTDTVEVGAGSITTRTDTAPEQATAARLDQAAVVIAGGRGLERAENVALLSGLAQHVPGAAVGASAAIVTDEWAPKSMMVGKTGARIAPDLYVAVGISGSFFHESNTRAARYLLAVNRDPEALLPARADLCLVGDAAEILTALTAALGA